MKRPAGELTLQRALCFFRRYPVTRDAKVLRGSDAPSHCRPPSAQSSRCVPVRFLTLSLTLILVVARGAMPRDSAGDLCCRSCPCGREQKGFAGSHAGATRTTSRHRRCWSPIRANARSDVGGDASPRFPKRCVVREGFGDGYGAGRASTVPSAEAEEETSGAVNTWFLSDLSNSPAVTFPS